MSHHAAPVRGRAAGHKKLRRAILVAFIIVTAALAAVGAALHWPTGAPAVTPQFEQTFSYNQPLVTGEVIRVDDKGCTTPAIGRLAQSEPGPVVVPLAEQPLPGQPAQGAGLQPNATCRLSVVRITGGDHAGAFTQLASFDMPGEPRLEDGDAIMMTDTADPITGEPIFAFADYQRGTPLILWGIVLAVVLVLFAAWRGVRAIAGLLITLAAIGFFMLPGLALGDDAITLTLITGVLALLVVVPLVHGINWKSASALGGTYLALGVAALVTHYALTTTQVRGLGSGENLNILLYLPEVPIAGLLAAGFIIGTLGVLNDVTISQASTITELADIEPEAGPWRLFLGAMKVGRDHITSMVYTIVLSYTGAALPLLLLITIADRPLSQTFSGDVMATELLRSGVGALVLTLAVPITTIIAAFVVPEHAETPTRRGIPAPTAAGRGDERTARAGAPVVREPGAAGAAGVARTAGVAAPPFTPSIPGYTDGPSYRDLR